MNMKVIEYDKYEETIITGDKDSGKSTLLELIGEQFYKSGRIVLDLFGARDDESCFWSIPDKTSYPSLIITPPYKILDISRCSYDIKTVTDTIGIKQILRQAIKERRIITFATSLYKPNDLLVVLSEWIRTLLDLMEHDIEFMDEEAVVLIREAANIVFSRRRVNETQSLTQTALMLFLRHARHARTSSIWDTQRFLDIDPSLRFHFAKRLIKKTSNVPKDLLEYDKEIYQKFLKWKKAGHNKRLPNIAFLRQYECYLRIGQSNAPYFFPQVPLPGFYHKTPQDNFLQKANIRVILKPEEERDTEFLDKRQVKELRYLRKAASVVAYHIRQKELIFEGKPYTFTLWAEETEVTTSTLSKYKLQK